MKTAIDARMIESSGIGSYIKTAIKSSMYSVAIGDEKIIRKYRADIEVIPFNAKIYGLKEQFFYPYRALKKAGVKRLHVPHYNVPIFYRGELVVTIHDLTHLYFPEYFSPLARMYAKFMLKKAVKKSAKILTVSDFVKGEIVEKLKADEEKVIRIYNCVDKDFVVKDKVKTEYLYEKYSIPSDRKVVLFVGNLKPHKNLSALIKAYAESDYKEQSCLVLVGKSFDDVSIIKSLEKIPQNCMVISTGAVNKEELVNLYNIAYIFAFPSLSEGFGIPLLEAMACGTPVVCSDKTSVPEVVGDCALTFDPRNSDEITAALNKIMSDKVLYAELKEKGLERVKEFSEDRMLNELQEALRNK